MNMTDEEILSAAESCGMMLFGLGMDKAKFDFSILAFAKFVGEIERFKEREACGEAAMKAAEKAVDVAMKLEREACAKVADHSFGVIGSTIALAIRARGEQA